MTLNLKRQIILIVRREKLKKKKLHIDIDEEIKFKLDELSKKRGMKTNELIRFILSEYLLKEGKK